MMIMRSVHNRMKRNLDNPILMLLGLAIFLIVFCIGMILGNIKDTFKNLWDRLYYV